jgi:hypothetical protein
MAVDREEAGHNGARSKAWTFFAHSNTGIVGSSLTWGMDVCVRLFCVCVGSGLATGSSPIQGVYRLCIGLKNLKKAAKVHKGCRVIDASR